MKRPACEKHKFDIMMHRLYIRIKNKWTPVGWICLYCGDNIIDKNTTYMDKNQKSILDFKKNKDDETIR